MFDTDNSYYCLEMAISTDALQPWLNKLSVDCRYVN